jgi:hypothetical protein
MIEQATDTTTNQVAAGRLYTIVKPNRKLIDVAFGPKVGKQLDDYVAALRAASPNSKIPVGILNPSNMSRSIEAAQTAQASMDKFMEENFLSELNKPTMEPAKVYEFLLRPGNETRLEKSIDFFNAHDPRVVAQLRQTAMVDLLHRAIEPIPTALANAMKQYTRKQLDLLFPNGLADALQNVADVAKHLFPSGEGDMAAGLAAGAVKAALPFGIVGGKALSGGVGGFRIPRFAFMVYGWASAWNWILSKPRFVLLLSQGLGTPGPARELSIQVLQWLPRMGALGVLGTHSVGAPVDIPEPGE